MAISGTQVDDLVDFAAHVRAKSPSDMSFFLGGHSMGALMALHAALQKQNAWHGLVLGTATVDVEWKPLLRWETISGNADRALRELCWVLTSALLLEGYG